MRINKAWQDCPALDVDDVSAGGNLYLCLCPGGRNTPVQNHHRSIRYRICTSAVNQYAIDHCACRIRPLGRAVTHQQTSRRRACYFEKFASGYPLQWIAIIVVAFDTHGLPFSARFSESAASPPIAPRFIESKAELGTIIKDPFSFNPSKSMFMPRSWSATGLS